MASLIPLTLACLIFSAATESGLTGVTSIDVPREFFIFVLRWSVRSRESSNLSATPMIIPCNYSPLRTCTLCREL